MNGRSVYLRITDRKDKSVTFDSRRAWDVDLFMTSQQDQARKQGEKDRAPGRYVVEMITQDDYRKATGKL